MDAPKPANATPFYVATAVCAALALGLVAWLLFKDPGHLPEQQDLDDAGTGEDRAARFILHGAERAFKGGLPETAARFYEDVDLRFSHTETYERRCEAIWEEWQRCWAKMGSGAEAGLRYIAGRKALHERWMKLRKEPRVRAELEAFLKDLPGNDGRRPQAEAWLDPR